MKNYKLYHKNKLLLNFEIQNFTPISCQIYIENTKYLPLPLKRIINNKEEFIDKTMSDVYIVNDDGCYLFDYWLSNREVPVNRDNYQKYITNKSSARKWMLENHSCSYTDCYWTKEDSECINYKDILDYLQNIDTYENHITIKEGHEMYKGQNSTLGGQLEKFWYKSGDSLKLCKKTDKLYDVINAREIIASLIYQKQGFDNYCDYKFLYNTTGEVIGCKCQAFTNVNEELIDAYDLLEEYNLTQQDSVYELIPTLAEKYGGDSDEIAKQMDLQTLVDFICMNRDRHQGNIGFLRNSDTMQIIKMAPVFDSGSCKHLEGELPETVGIMKINGLYSTEKELLSHVKDFLVLDVNKLPRVKEISDIYDKCTYISKTRKEKLLELYQQRVNFIKERQLSQELEYDFNNPDEDALDDDTTIPEYIVRTINNNHSYNNLDHKLSNTKKSEDREL